MTNYNLQFLDVETLENKFGDWLRANRKKNYLTMEALAQKAGISKQYISVLERGEPHPLTDKPVTPKLELVETLAKALNANLDEARLAAGYAPVERNHNWTERVRIALLGLDDMTDDEKELTLKNVEIFVAGIRASRKQKRES